jgi:signal transduction histidine kinase
VISFKDDEAGILKSQILPTLQHWSMLESNRSLFELKNQPFLAVFTLIATVAISLYVPLAVVAIWLIMVIGSYFRIRHLRIAYLALLNANANSITADMVQIVHKYKTAYLVKCSVWCGLSFLSQLWLPLTARLLCLAILNALVFLSITQTYVDRRLMRQILTIFLLSQLFIVVLRLMLYSDDVEIVKQVSVYSFYLLLMGYLLWVVGVQFNQAYMQRLSSEYVKMQLIETLNQSKTQLNLEQKALTASNKLVQQFYSGAAHDLRQPVYAMQLYTAMLSEDQSQNQFLLPKITQSCIAINDMFNTLFDYQQTHMYDTELVERDINIQDTFKSLALHFEPIAAEKGLQIRFKPIQGSINMVPLYLVRILSNLIANALRYTNKGGVLVTTRKTHKNLRFEIWDTGIGIENSNMQKIFNEFYKINTQTVDDFVGKERESIQDNLGLGLAIVKQLASRLEKTDITVKSRVGRGSVFIFTVPLDRYTAA